MYVQHLERRVREWAHRDDVEPEREERVRRLGWRCWVSAGRPDPSAWRGWFGWRREPLFDLPVERELRRRVLQVRVPELRELPPFRHEREKSRRRVRPGCRLRSV